MSSNGRLAPGVQAQYQFFKKSWQRNLLCLVEVWCTMNHQIQQNSPLDESGLGGSQEQLILFGASRQVKWRAEL